MLAVDIESGKRMPQLEDAIVAALDSAQPGLGRQVKVSPHTFGVAYDRFRNGGLTLYNPDFHKRVSEILGADPSRTTGSYVGRQRGCRGSSLDASAAWVGAHEVSHQLGYVGGISVGDQRNANGHFQRAVTAATAARGIVQPHSSCQ